MTIINDAQVGSLSRVLQQVLPIIDIIYQSDIWISEDLSTTVVMDVSGFKVEYIPKGQGHV